MSDHPNIVVIMTDQQRADHCAREGFPLDTQPFLDSLAAGGVWFDHAYTPNPTCLPARVSMMTGRYPSVTGVRSNQQSIDPHRAADLIDVMTDAGYRTALCGKNHSHLTSDRLDYWSHYSHSAGFGRDDTTEQEAAFDEWINGLHHAASPVAAPFPVECQGPCRATRDAMNWIDSLPDDPFFLWLSFAEPHNPFQVPEPYFSMFPPESLRPTRSGPDAWKDRGFKWQFVKELGRRGFDDYDQQIPRARANYCGMLRLIDDQVKRFVEFLDARGLRDNTLVVFVSDHGDFVGEYGLVRKGPEMPDVLMRIPMIWTGPNIKLGTDPILGESQTRELGKLGSVPSLGGAHSAHVSLCDILPTLCEAIGREIPYGVQGRSLWPMLTGQDYPTEEFASAYGEQGMGGLHYVEGDTLVDPIDDGLHESIAFDCLNSRTQSGIMRMCRKGDWKLAFDMNGRGQLFNLAEDPVELNNRYDDPTIAPVREDMLKELLGWSLRVQDPLPLPKQRYVMKTDPHNYWSPYRETQ